MNPFAVNERSLSLTRMVLVLFGPDFYFFCFFGGLCAGLGLLINYLNTLSGMGISILKTRHWLKKCYENVVIQSNLWKAESQPKLGPDT